MTRRLFWLAMGVTIGALVVRKLSRLADRLTAARHRRQPGRWPRGALGIGA